MTALDIVGVVAAASVFLAFCFVRDVSAYIKTCIAIVLGTGLATVFCVAEDTVSEGIILVVGVALFGFGLLFVRIMFIRSVSLNMLRSIQDGSAASFGEDIGGRLRDMRRFRLSQQTVEENKSAHEQSEKLNALSKFGRLVSTVTAALYALLRVKT